MKTFRFTATVVAALLLTTTLTGCSDDSLEDGYESVAGQQAAIGFGTYLSRATTTRGTPFLEPAEIALGGGVGVFAMQTEGKKYDPAVTDGSAETDFDANLMQNIHLKSTLTDDELQSTDADVADSWTYAPVRYWPKGTSDYASFMAYAPYSEDYGTLYDKDGHTTGDLTYIRHTVAPDPRDQTDLMYGDPANTTNMQLRRNADNTWAETGTFYAPTGSSDAVPSVPLKLKHALSRIGFVVTSSALKDPYNYYIVNDGKVVSAGDIGDELIVQIYASADSYFYIVVNKVMFLGDNTSAESGNPTGAFAKSSLLNLANTSDSKPLWQTDAQGKLAITYDNNDTVRTVPGTLYDEDATNRPSYKWQEGDVIGENGKYLWAPDVRQNQVESFFGYDKEYFLDWDKTEQWWKDYLKSQGMTEEQVTSWWSYYRSTIRYYWNYYSEYYIYQKRVYGLLDPATTGNGFKSVGTIYPVGNSDDDYMLVIPQDFSDGSGNDLWVYIDYTVHYVEGVSSNIKENGIRYKQYGKIKQNFLPGHAYVVVMDINGEGKQFNTVNFSVKATDWPAEKKAEASQ